MEDAHTVHPTVNSNRAFWRGFMRGMAAPMMLFSHYSAPEIRTAPVTPLYRPAKSDTEAMRRDMIRIGNDFRSAIRKYAVE